MMFCQQGWVGISKFRAALAPLSGGEFERLKLAVELKEPKPIYISGEPTTGLHFKDIQKLIKVFDELISYGKIALIFCFLLSMFTILCWRTIHNRFEFCNIITCLIISAASSYF